MVVTSLTYFAINSPYLNNSAILELTNEIMRRLKILNYFGFYADFFQK